MHPKLNQTKGLIIYNLRAVKNNLPKETME